MKRFTMFLSAVIFFTCTALVIEAKKKKSSEVNSSAQNFRVNYRFWDRQVKCLRSMKGYPENTYEGIQEAILKGYNIIRCEVAFSKDNVPFLCRGGKVPGINGMETTRNYHSSTLSEHEVGLRYGEQFKGIPMASVSEILALCHRTNAILELDCTNKESCPNENYILLYNMVKKHNMLGSVIFYDEAKNLESLLEIDKNVIIDISHSVLADSLDYELSVAAKAAVAEFSIRANMYTPEIGKRIHQAGYMITLWPTESNLEMRKFTKEGIDRLASKTLGPTFHFRLERMAPPEQ